MNYEQNIINYKYCQWKYENPIIFLVDKWLNKLFLNFNKIQYFCKFYSEYLIKKTILTEMNQIYFLLRF